MRLILKPRLWIRTIASIFFSASRRLWAASLQRWPWPLFDLSCSFTYTLVNQNRVDTQADKSRSELIYLFLWSVSASRLSALHNPYCHNINTNITCNMSMPYSQKPKLKARWYYQMNNSEDIKAKSWIMQLLVPSTLGKMAVVALLCAQWFEGCSINCFQKIIKSFLSTLFYTKFVDY